MTEITTGIQESGETIGRITMEQTPMAMAGEIHLITLQAVQIKIITHL